jgi:hypothetical protein
MKRYITLATLVILIGFKFFAIIIESNSPSLANVVPALMYACFFGSPQLFWLSKGMSPDVTAKQQWVIAEVALVFVVLSVYFGSFPGSTPPSWSGGQAHFEVPVALVGEWIVALLALIPFRQAKGPT